MPLCRKLENSFFGPSDTLQINRKFPNGEFIIFWELSYTKLVKIIDREHFLQFLILLLEIGVLVPLCPT